jgi:hypothetical protein
VSIDVTIEKWLRTRFSITPTFRSEWTGCPGRDGTGWVTALGITWVLDGLEVSIVAALGPVLTHTTTLHERNPKSG